MPPVSLGLAAGWPYEPARVADGSGLELALLFRRTLQYPAAHRIASWHEPGV